MLRFNHKQLLGFTVAGALVVTAAGTPVSADEMVQNLGPVGPREPVLASVGTKRIIAFYLPYSSGCAVHAVIWNNNNNYPHGLIARFWPNVADSAERFRISLKPGQIAHIDSDDNVSLALQCGDDAKTLSIIDNEEHTAFGISIRGRIKASASGF